MALTSIREKYQESLAKDAKYKSSQKPRLGPIESAKTFWENPQEKEICGGQTYGKLHGQTSNLSQRRAYWSSKAVDDEEGHTDATKEKAIKTFHNKKVENLTKTWQDIVYSSLDGLCKRPKSKNHSFIGYYGSRVNVSEMSGKYEDRLKAKVNHEEDKGGELSEESLEKRQDKEQKWEQVLSKPPKMKVNATTDKESDVEHLCKAIYDHGEQYMDGTAAISFTTLKIAFRGSGNLINAITKAKKFGIVDHDGEQAYSLEADDVVVLLVPVFKVVEAFQEMRSKHPETSI